MKYRFIILTCFFPLIIWSQDSTSYLQKSKFVGSRNAILELSSSLEQNESDDIIAIEYERLAKELTREGDYIKAIDYLERARKLYEKLNDKEKESLMEREIAKIEELQNNIHQAIDRYVRASQLSQVSLQQQINTNDAQRLINQSLPKVSADYTKKNIELFKVADQKEDRAFALQQMAQLNVRMNENEAAIENLQKAREELDNHPLQTIQLERQMAEVYISDNQIDKGIESLNNAYELAIQEGRTLDAKQSMIQLAHQYRNKRNYTKALEIYDDFLNQLEVLVRGDSSLIDNRFFQVHEERILRLENERMLTAEMMRKTTNFNTILLILMFLLLLSVLIIYRINRTVLKNNKKIALQSLRREMNPHFIFNSLNSVNQFISQNRELEANKYLSSYSRLMRNVLENSNKDFTPLSVEIEQLKEYLDLEHMRFHDKFDYQINIDDSIDTDVVLIPNMLIQPQVENAIWHGLRYKEEKGELSLSFCMNKNSLDVIIEDNGIGIEKSRTLKTSHQKYRQSRGIKNTQERIDLLNSLYRCRIIMKIVDKQEPETGVVLTFHFPLNKR